MPKIAYKNFNFAKATNAVIYQANEIIEDYQAQGFELTLRQLYYQFVARALIPNTEQSYKRIGSIINDARLAGLIDWDALEDRTRNLRGRTHWNSPSDIMDAVGRSYFKNMWSNQEYRPEVWIEKDALIGVIEGVCNELDVPYFSCRGYTSQSEMWRAGQRLERHVKNGQQPLLFHLGDHDPSGMDMSRDIADRLELFMGGTQFNRIALNMDQIAQYGPPPNPAKIEDSRAAGYIKLYGRESWELDALEPRVLADLIRSHIESYRDLTKWNERADEIAREKETLSQASRQWNEVVTFLGGVLVPNDNEPGTRLCFICYYCDEAIPDHYDLSDMGEQQCEGCSKFFCNSHLGQIGHNCEAY